MRTLSKTGLSMSQAQSISNLCNQRAQNINNIINSINNAEKSLQIGKDTYVQEPGIKMPNDILDLILMKSKLHATQAFLMEAIKSKDDALKLLKDAEYTYSIPVPERQMAPSVDLLETVNEAWGQAQLSDAEVSECLEKEAYAAHIGQFIHNRSKLSELRNELISMPTLEWITIKDGEKTPVKVKKHHTVDQLNELHEKFAKLHREYEQRVNYFKAKIKNLVSLENAAIQKKNSDLLLNQRAVQNDFDATWKAEYTEWNTLKLSALMSYESEREDDIKSIAQMRINVDPRFQDVIDIFMDDTKE